MRRPAIRDRRITRSHGFIAHIGEISLGLIARAYSILGFFGLVCATVVAAEAPSAPAELTAIVAQMEQTGVNALPIVGLLTFLIGVVIAYQGADYLRFYGLRELYRPIDRGEHPARAGSVC